ncbi:hypothetical protein L1887_38681 [Cichorium endivia]|nr:hypothetical protein L1887_38681 [Cichorium endivia]
MTNPHALARKTTNFFRISCKLSDSKNTCKRLSSSLVHAKLPNPFWVQLSYFLLLSLLGFVALKTTEFKTSSFRPKNIDLFFTAVSAVTVSSMSTLDMEIFSNAQLIVIMFLMFMGGEVFVSLLGLQFRKFKHIILNFGSNSDSDSAVGSLECSIELGVRSNDLKPFPRDNLDQKYLMYESNKSLGYVVLCYILVVHFIGFILVYFYITFNPDTKSLLINEGLSRHTFSLFITVSTFANCGFVPTNENMTVFKKNSGLLLILIPQILLGSTLYPVVLRAVIIILEKITKRVELSYMLKYPNELSYGQMFPTVHSFYLAATVLGLMIVQFVLFCAMEWHNVDAMDGLTSYEKVVGSFFQVMNTRYAGEAVFDLSKISPTILVVFIVMMYLPPFTTYLPVEDSENSQRRHQKKSFEDYLLFSPLTYLILFTALICLSEQKQMESDPLNFNVLNIVFEVVSAYGNVGLSVCYSCQRQIKSDRICKEEWYGFAGRWTNNGKYFLILVMFFGRLKNFNKNGGRFWKVL